MLVNTLYFLADWEKDFDADSTRKEPFTTQDGQELDVDMMRRGFLAKYHEDERFQAISIPYKGGRFAWTGLLPKPGSGASDLVEWLSGETWESLAANMKYAECDLKLPRFKIEFGTEEMKDYLKEMGMVVPFDAFAADFSGMTVRGEDLYIYTVLHKSYIEVDEEGTEAAAATVVGMDAGASAPVDMHTVRFDHPFVFIIHDTQTNTVLFHGQFNKPL